MLSLSRSPNPLSARKGERSKEDVATTALLQLCSRHNRGGGQGWLRLHAHPNRKQEGEIGHACRYLRLGTRGGGGLEGCTLMDQNRLGGWKAASDPSFLFISPTSSTDSFYESPHTGSLCSPPKINGSTILCSGKLKARFHPALNPDSRPWGGGGD